MASLQLSLFSQVVESFYDSAMNPPNWQRTLGLVAVITDSPVVSMGIIDHERGSPTWGFAHGVDDETFALYANTFAVMNPLLVARHLRPVGSVDTASMLISEQEFLESRLYKEFAAPHGWRHFIGVHALRSGPRSGGLSAARMITQPCYGDRDLEMFALLSPHICRAFAIADALGLKTFACAALESTLDALTTGVVLLDPSERIVYMNRAAEAKLKHSGALRSVAGRLCARDSAANATLHADLQMAMAECALSASHRVSIALPAPVGAGLVATVLPLRGEQRNKFPGPPAAACAVFLQDPQDVPPLPGEAFAKLHGLTAGELRVLLALAPGRTVKEAAGVLGIAEATAKTHLLHVFGKTGTSKQTELMRLLISTAAAAGFIDLHRSIDATVPSSGQHEVAYQRRPSCPTSARPSSKAPSPRSCCSR